ncbi:ribosome small subunit-dependent GTPase A [Alicyclobacillus vulcanalis]|uniref:Small ribosomal subunit biogenesis GTPase RsgA n=1 Tax=Alicyclobacillus vulcanalis TaxID=252246 RepID=A0A1N7NRF9_9BACL|nr:ribosome small subunit-dependent GTPase A [Alicyclobacillus vulcanalis]SIT00882.1 ribosome biogenesis GTPase [Alicyclobacillus vulcanalis]
MREGRVIRAISGFFDVFDDGNVVRCRARGVFKVKGTTVLVGDFVRYEPTGTQEGVIREVLERRTELIRPPIANVDHVVIACSFVTPDLNLYMLDKILLLASVARVEPTIAFTKADLASPENVRAICDLYRRAGYTAMAVAAKQALGVAEIRARLQGRVTVLAGPSGAGKSTLASALAPGMAFKTGEVSGKIGRGRQTTRHVELVRLDDDTWMADAPGFSQLQVPVASRDVKHHFPEFRAWADACAYRDCLHLDEEACAVRRAAEEGRVAPSRYASYRQLYQEAREQELNAY